MKDMLMGADHLPQQDCDGVFFAFTEKHTAPDFSPTKISNTFQDLGAADMDDDDHEDLAAAIQELTCHVNTGPRLSQRQRKQQSRPKPLTQKQIQEIADKINRGEIKLPDLKLDTNADYDAVWALVDSGSSVHAVDMRKTFPGAKIQAPPPDAN